MAASNSFDMSRAWEEATALLRANRQVVAVVSGVFFFLPYLAVTMLVPDLGTIMGTQSVGGDPEAAMAAMEAAFLEYWWVFVLLAVVQGVGTLGLLAMLGRDGRPTLGEALTSGLAGLLPYLAANILVAFAIVLILAILVMILSLTGSQAIASLPIVLAFPVMIYVYVKISLLAPVIAGEDSRNPVAAVRRSWGLTKGNSFRLLLFYALLIVAFIVVSLVLTMIFGVLFALLGETAGLIGGAIVSSAINAVMMVVLLAAMAAAHRQLSGHATRASMPSVPSVTKGGSKGD